jgi:hypothetical protein
VTLTYTTLTPILFNLRSFGALNHIRKHKTAAVPSLALLIWLLVAAGAQSAFCSKLFCDPTYRFALRVARPNNAAPTTAPRLALGWVSSQVERLRENDHLPRSPSILSSPSTGSKR